MTADASAVVARLGGDKFLAQAFGRNYHMVPGDAATVADLLNWDDLNEILSRHRLEVPRLRLSTNGITLPQSAYTTPVVSRRSDVWQRLHPASLHQQLAGGATLVLDAIEDLHPGVHRLASELQTQFRTGVQVNLYASWTGTEGFGTHWDDHDVVVVQLDGAKRWKIFEPTRKVPMHNDVAEAEDPPKTPVAEFVMTAGDMLYLPRGWWHSVSASEGVRSLHLTCGLTTTTGADLIIWLSEMLRREEIIRTDVPRFGTPEQKQAFTDSLREVLTTELASGDVIDRYSENRDAIEGIRLRPSLPHIAEIPAEPDLVARLLTTRHTISAGHDGTVVLTAGGSTWEFAEAARPVLERLADQQPHHLADLIDGTSVSLTQAASLLTELVGGQVAAVGSEG